MSLEGWILLRNLVGLGALFHDVGKLQTRLEKPEEEGSEKSLSEEHKYKHERLGKGLIEQLLKKVKVFSEEGRLKESLKEICREFNLLEDCEKIDPKEVVLSAFHHHEPKNAGDYEFFARIFQLADRLSASEREEELKDTFTEAKRLHPIFERIGTDENLKGEWVYPIRVLEVNRNTTSEELKKVIFPFPLSEQPFEKPSEERKFFPELFEEVFGEYGTLFGKFKEKLESPFIVEETDLSKLASKVYYLFYKYLWSVPSSIYDPKNRRFHYPDISLFDHSRTTAAIATSLITEYNLRNLDERKAKLLLVEGDVSGIQKFLFGITNTRGASKRLRARSFFLSLLPELIANFILEGLGYNPTVNTLFVGAGKFQLLVGYEEKIEEKLKKLQRKVEEVLLKEFGGRLGFVLGWVEFPLERLKDYKNLVRELHSRLNEQKRRKFVLTLPRAEGCINERFEKLIAEEVSTAICSSCRWEVVEDKGEESENICKWCKTFQEVGGALPKVEYLAFSRDEKFIPAVWRAYFKLPGLGLVFLLSGEDFKILTRKGEGKILLQNGEFVDRKKLLRELRIFKLNATDIENNPYLLGFRFIAQAVPSIVDKEVLKPILEEEERKEGDILSFVELQELALGDKKLGYLKADVDNLGLIFMAKIERYTFSRVATLSRMLDLFFSLYVDRLLIDFKGKLLKEYPEGLNNYIKGIRSPVYTVYSGGDDLFLIAPWNVAVEVASLIREEFGEYTCQNSNFGISAGLGIFKGTFPIRLAADLTDELESKAKSKVSEDGKKDKISLLGSVLGWEDLKEVLKDIKPLEEAVFKGDLSRSMLYRLYVRLKAIKETTKEGSLERKEQLYRFVPYFYYQLARNVKKEELQKRLEELFIDPSSEDLINLERGLVFLSYLLMATRERSTSKVEG